MFLAKLPVIPFHNNTRVISTALDCIGGFSDWLAMHPSSSPRHPARHLGPHLPGLSLAASMALKDISRDCTDSTKPYAEAVIASIQQSLQADRLNPGECVRLMYPLGKMLSLLPRHHPPRLHPIVAKPLEELHQLSKGLPDNNAKARLLFVLNC